MEAEGRVSAWQTSSDVKQAKFIRTDKTMSLVVQEEYCVQVFEYHSYSCVTVHEKKLCMKILPLRVVIAFYETVLSYS